jgi:histidinol-phosphate phosphatase family domain/HAD-superfamily hydrolase, subfamily IIIA
MGVNTLTNKAVFLDRDGVINRSFVKDGKPFPPNSLDVLEILPNVHESLLFLKKKGFLLIVLTNQPDVGRGKQKREIVKKMNNYLLDQLPLDGIYVCWHGKDGECNCRKPLPGLLFQAAKDWRIDIKKSYLIGDRWRDIDMGYAAGCKTIFIDYQYDERLNYNPNYKTYSIRQAVSWIVKNNFL